MIRSKFICILIVLFFYIRLSGISLDLYRTVQRFAGHRDLSTTYTYYNFERKSKEEQAEAIDKALAL